MIIDAEAPCRLTRGPCHHLPHPWFFHGQDNGMKRSCATPRPDLTILMLLTLCLSWPLAARATIGTDGSRGTLILAVRDQSGTPAAYAGLYYGDEERGVTSVTYADATGRFAAYNVGAPLTLCAYIRTRPEQFGCLGPLTIPAGTTVVSELVLRPERVLSGDAAPGNIVATVRDTAGRPVPYAEISYDYGDYVSRNYADAQGRRVIRGSADGASIICAHAAAASGDIQAGCIGPFTVPTGATINRDLIIRPTTASGKLVASAQYGRGWVYGSVLLVGTRTPVSGAMVRIASTAFTSGPLVGDHFEFPALAVEGSSRNATYSVSVTPPPGYAVVGPLIQQVPVLANQGTEVNFYVQPAFTPFWVQTFVPDAAAWSGPDDHAFAFGTRPQWSYFLVVTPVAGKRLYAFDPLTRNYAWVDADVVGPSGPPGS